MSLKKIFAANLKKIRKQKGLTQEELAELVNVAPRHISFLETAKSFPSCDLLERLSKVLNTGFSEFFNSYNEVSRDEILKQINIITSRLDDTKLKYIYKMVSEL